MSRHKIRKAVIFCDNIAKEVFNALIRLTNVDESVWTSCDADGGQQKHRHRSISQMDDTRRMRFHPLGVFFHIFHGFRAKEPG